MATLQAQMTVGTPGTRRGLAAVAITPDRLSEADPRVDRALFTLRESAAYLDMPISTLHR